ncbi:replication endonuclease [Pseudomonas caricapapayae]|uniref:Replication endonuclease n=1 Tax=Pseudomonas caricapapayae TaxID=46678 RepID=A0ACC7LW05_9PSED
MKTYPKSIIPLFSKTQPLSSEILKNISDSAALYKKEEIQIYELCAKLKVIISSLSISTNTFDYIDDVRFEQKPSIPFLSDTEQQPEFEEKHLGKKLVILKDFKSSTFSYREKITDYDKETIAFANIINRLFHYICDNQLIKNLILEASYIKTYKDELADLHIYKSIRFRDLKGQGTIFDKVSNHYIETSEIVKANNSNIVKSDFSIAENREFRKLRRIIERVARRDRELHLLKIGSIGKNKTQYCSDQLLAYQEKIDLEQAEFIENAQVVIVKDDETEELKKLSDFALTDERKASELYMKAKDLEEQAVSLGYMALFTTFTCPPSFHPNPGNGSTKWDGSTPREASDWLSGRLVALNKDRERHGIETLGLWSKEAHKDQCPHMHSLFYVHPSQSDELKKLIYKHFGHSEKAVRIVEISEAEANKAGVKAASPTSYITKYIMKSLRDKSDEAMKNKAVARLWRYKTYNFFGKTKSVMWRKFNRFFTCDLKDLQKKLINPVFIKLALFRQENKFWQFCKLADEHLENILLEEEMASMSGFEYIKYTLWGYRVIGSNDYLQTKFNTYLRLKI